MTRYAFRIVTIPNYGHYIQVRAFFRWKFIRETVKCPIICCCRGMIHKRHRFFKDEIEVRNFIKKHFDPNKERPRLFWSGLANTWRRRTEYFIIRLKARMADRKRNYHR